MTGVQTCALPIWPITDHAHETLGPSDLMIARTRRRLLAAARSLRKTGKLPPGIDDPEVFRGARSGFFVSDDKSPWQEIYAKTLAGAVRPPAPRQAAE